MAGICLFSCLFRTAVERWLKVGRVIKPGEKPFRCEPTKRRGDDETSGARAKRLKRARDAIGDDADFDGEDDAGGAPAAAAAGNESAPTTKAVYGMRRSGRYTSDDLI